MQIDGYGTYIAAALLVYNVIVFVVYGVDKRRARKKEWRIPERTLLLIAALFGAAGALAGMLAFRHKTKHARFCILVPLFLLLQAALITYVCFSVK